LRHKASRRFALVPFTRSLYRVAPTLEILQDKWERMLADDRFAPVQSAIRAGLRNVRKWYQHLDDTDVYIMAMSKS
jgi:hypothetical protein